MFISERVFDVVVKTKDDAFAVALSAFYESHKIALGAKEVEIEALKRTIDDLVAQLAYERAKSDGLVDRLLVRDAKVAAVSPVAIEIAKHKDKEAVKKLAEIFDNLNDIAADPPPAPQGNRAFEFSGGGSAVTR